MHEQPQNRILFLDDQTFLAGLARREPSFPRAIVDAKSELLTVPQSLGPTPHIAASSELDVKCYNINMIDKQEFYHGAAGAARPLS
jgi:hypothetical protein